MEHRCLVSSPLQYGTGIVSGYDGTQTKAFTHRHHATTLPLAGVQCRATATSERGLAFHDGGVTSHFFVGDKSEINNLQSAAKYQMASS